MNLDDSPQEATWRATVRAWIANHHPGQPADSRMWSDGHKSHARRWQAIKADGGYAALSWPIEWGGAGASAIEEAIFHQEEQRVGLRFTYFMVGLQMLIPAMLRFNSDAQSRGMAAPALRGDSIWCQLFSEPSSGSDSAATRTAAVREGDVWTVNGQKVWNSGAHGADYGMVITRTDPAVPKHKGLTAFWVDMKTPGLEVRPIRMMSGDDELNEVFLTDMRIPDSQRVGNVGEGWKVVIATLMNERAAIGAGSGLSWAEIMAVARDCAWWDGSAMDDPAFREWLADYYVNAEGIRLLAFQTLTSLSKGEQPGPESAAGKLLWANDTQDLANRAIDLMDRFGILDGRDDVLMGGAFQHRWLWAPGLRLGGGADEIMKNIIAERVLGLPGDIRVDKDVAFRDIPTGR